MVRATPSDAPAWVRRPAVDLIDAVLTNMRNYREPLKYSVVAPSRYTVYVHPDEIARLNGILPLLREQAERALSEEVAKLNRRSVVRTWLDRLFPGHRPATESASGSWHVEFLADPDGELDPGGILVHSELLLPSAPELGVGQRTRRITTVRMGAPGNGAPQTTTHVQVDDASTPLVDGPTTKVHVRARLAYDDGAGQPAYDIVKDSVTIGRGGAAYPVSMKIAASADVSREHARVRFDPGTGSYFLIDLSSLGTTVNGVRVPRGYDDAGGSKRENGVEVPLPDGARIGLADVVFLTFRVVGAVTGAVTGAVVAP
jgi:hypothetical protein